jgi:hypothetical protein
MRRFPPPVPNRHEDPRGGEKPTPQARPAAEQTALSEHRDNCRKCCPCKNDVVKVHRITPFTPI